MGKEEVLIVDNPIIPQYGYYQIYTSSLIDDMVISTLGIQIGNEMMIKAKLFVAVLISIVFLSACTSINITYSYAYPSTWQYASSAKENPAAAKLDAIELKLLTDTAEKICGAVPLNGEQNSFNQQGVIGAELGKLSKKLAGLGFKISEGYSSESYTGLLRQDLARALHDNANCKLHAFSVLIDRVRVDKHLKPSGNKDVGDTTR